MKEFRDLKEDPSPEFVAFPLESDLFEWHFTVRGPPSDGFKGGRYHGRIIFPADYPFKPPNFVFLTENGRFETNKKICLSISGYHPESWRPAWGVRTALVAIISFFTTPGEGSVGAIEWSEAERTKAAIKSVEFVCSVCGCDNRTCLPSEQEVPSQVFELEPELVLTEPIPREASDTKDIPTQGTANDAAESTTTSDPVVAPPATIEAPTPTPIHTASNTAVVDPVREINVSIEATRARLDTYRLVWKIDMLIIFFITLLSAYWFTR
jgi:ubiquitin-conjugating enzyme E2 J1